MSKTKDNIDFKFISEEPKKSKANDPLSFGHDQIVNALESFTITCHTPFTIGLFGKWGSGKSTIVENLQDNLITKGVPTIIFDVWKHEGDALRRTFLKDIDTQLKSERLTKFYKENFELDARLVSNTTTIREEIKLKRKELLISLVVTLGYFLIFLIGIALIWFLFVYRLNWLSPSDYSFKFILTIFLSAIPFASVLTKLTEKYTDKKKTEIKNDKFQDPHEFEAEFNNVLNNIIPPRAVIVFDNLDRVSGENAVKIISTIKTFLEPIDKKNEDKEVVFLIPCDVEAIKNHLKKIFAQEVENSQTGSHADEYLRKFFNTIVWIPEFFDTELEKLATEKLAETKISDFDNQELSALIVFVFDQNPRQIIQFINILVANYQLLKQRNIPNFSLKDNVPQLAKYLLLIQRFPEVMEVYRKGMLYNLEDGTTLVALLNEQSLVLPQNEMLDFNKFKALTEHVYIDSLEVFFKFKISEFESTFENSSRLIKLIESNRIKDLFEETIGEKNEEKEKEKENDKKYLDSLELKNKQYELSQIVKQKISSTSNPVIAFKFINGVLYLTKKYDLELEYPAYREIIQNLKKGESHFQLIDPSSMISECVNKSKDKDLRGEFISVCKKQWLSDFESYKQKE